MLLPVSLPDRDGNAWQRFRCTPIWWLFVILCIPFEFVFGVFKVGLWSSAMAAATLCAALSALMLAALYSAVLATWFRLHRRI